MKGLLRSFVVHLVVLWVIAQFVGGIQYHGNFLTLAFGALALTLANLLIKPFLNLLLLPFNLVTFGAFRWITSVITLYLTTLAVPGFSISPFHYPGLVSSFIVLPPVDFSLTGAYIFISILVSFISSVILWGVR